MRAMQANQSQSTRSTLDGTTGSGSFKPWAAGHPPRNSRPTARPLGAAGRSADSRDRSAPILGRVRIGDALGLSPVWVQGSSFSPCFLKRSGARRSSASGCMQWAPSLLASGSTETSGYCVHTSGAHGEIRSEEHTSELQSQSNLVCRLLLEKKKKIL